MSVNAWLVKSSESFATQHSLLNCLQGIGESFLAIISQLPSVSATLVEKVRHVAVIFKSVYDYRYIGYNDKTASLRNMCRRRDLSVETDFIHGHRSVLN